jgi:hypothetical protein
MTFSASQRSSLRNPPQTVVVSSRLFCWLPRSALRGLKWPRPGPTARRNGRAPEPRMRPCAGLGPFGLRSLARTTTATIARAPRGQVDDTTNTRLTVRQTHDQEPEPFQEMLYPRISESPTQILRPNAKSREHVGEIIPETLGGHAAPGYVCVCAPRTHPATPTRGGPISRRTRNCENRPGQLL